MIKVTGADGINYIIDEERYWPEEALKEALGCKDDDIFGVIKRLREERERYKSNCDYFAGIAKDQLRDRNKLELELREALCTVDEYADIPGLVRKLKKERDELEDRVRTYRFIANGTYGDSCGYSGDKTPAFFCNVISYSWELGSVTDRDLMGIPTYRVCNDSIRVELSLTPTASYKGAFDMEDLKRYIQEYGREKKLGIVESVDYQNAKVARVELANLYKTVLGKEKLDRDLSPHEVMKAILDEYKRVKDSRFAFSQSLQSVYMHVYEGTGYNASDIYAAPDKIADWIITRYDSTKKLSRMETLCDINDCIDELCDKYNVVQPERIKTTRERLDYIFGVLDDYRSMHDTEWDESLSYTSAMNDINEEYKRVVHNFEERTADWSKAQQELDRYARFRSNICTALCLGGETSDEDILKRVRMTKECHDKLCKDYTKLHDDYVASQKQVKGFTNRCDSLENLRQDLWEFRKNAIEDLKNRDFLFRPEEDEDLPEIFVKLLKRYDDYFSRYKEQFGLRQMWHVRWESENERANGVQKKLDKLRGIEAERDKYKENCKYWSDMYSSSEAACGALKGKIRELQEEKTKVISALGQDIWDDCLK